VKDCDKGLILKPMNQTLELKVQPVPGRPDTRILRFEGEFDASAVERVLEETTALLESGVQHLIADFEELRYINSTGLGVVLHFSRTARERGGSFRLCRVTESVFEIIEIIGATALLEIHDTLEEALQSV
jgi:anti-anti-sigma factor